MPSEGSIQRAIVRKFKKLPNIEVEVRHGSMFSVKGQPDIHGCWFGRHFEIEVKQPGEEPSKLQYYRLKRWQNAGAIVGWAINVDEALKIISAIKDPCEYL